ncbi:MAG TPA: trigger factor [Solirubrobacteraceae bacterium]|jgi:trigger factor|nr:trigger factor [Solirubrobacteraceae bacterium]
MPTALKTTVTELPESRVRVQVEVPSSEIEDRLARKARQLGREMKLPGFRRGKVPAPLVIQRVGREVVLEEAVRDTLGSWYSDAIETAGIVPVGDPQLDLADLPGQGAALEFSIEIGVLPTAQLGNYKGLEVGRREVIVEDEAIQQEVDGLRDRLARLETVERPAAPGDFVVVDYLGSIAGEPFEGGEGRDQLIELGSGNLIPGFEEGLEGSAAGEARTIEVSFPTDYQSEQLAGADASFEVTVKEVKHKLLPEVDEDFAVDMGFDSVEELTEDIRTRLADADAKRIEAEFREAALDAAASEAHVETPEALIQAKAREMWDRMLHSLSHRGITREVYLKITGREEDDLIAELLPDAGQSLRREAVIAAIVATEKIVPSEEDLLEVLTPTAEREGVEPQKLLEELRDSGRLEDIREDLAARQAVELIASEATPIPIEQAQAREKLWTPESEEKQGESGGEAAAARLWTPER